MKLSHLNKIKSENGIGLIIFISSTFIDSVQGGLNTIARAYLQSLVDEVEFAKLLSTLSTTFLLKIVVNLSDIPKDFW